MLTITLNNQSYTAENPTLNELLTLVSLLLPGNTEQERIEAIHQKLEKTKLYGFNLEDELQRKKATAVLMVRLQNPAAKARVSYTLKSLFPALPDSLIQYRLVQLPSGDRWEDFTYKLEDDQLMKIITAAAAWATKHFAQATPEAKGTAGKGFAQKQKLAIELS